MSDNPYAQKGRRGFLPGNPGRPGGPGPNAIKRGNRRRDHVLRSAVAPPPRIAPGELILLANADDLAKVIVEQSVPGGDFQAAKAAVQALRLIMPNALPRQLYIEGHADLADRPVAPRIIEISRRVALGDLSVEAGRALQDLAKVELDAAIIRPLREVLADFLGSHDQRRLLDGVRALLTRMESAIDGEFEVIGDATIQTVQ